jgi:beta-lactam-binding protein with PASTA domain
VALVIALLALRGEQIVVPEVRGQTVEQAQQTLVNAGLESTPRIQEQVVADAAQVGRVIAQNPAAGEEIDSDGAAILQAGVANQVVDVPDVRGATRDQAQQLLGAAGLTLGAIDPGDAPADAIVDFQNPAAGEDARLGSPVNLILVEPEAPEEEEAAPEQPAPEQPEVPADQVPEAPPS